MYFFIIKSDIDSELIAASVWRDERVPVGVVADDFVGKFSKFPNWKCFGISIREPSRV